MLEAFGKHAEHKLQKVTGTARINKLIQEEEWDLVIQQAKSHPGEVRSWSCRPGFFEGVKDSDVLPIHEAVSMGAPVNVVKALVEAFPQGLTERESAYRRLPIHIACRHGGDKMDKEVVKYLIGAYPLGVATDDILGRVPLHYTCSNGAEEEIVDMLMTSCAGATRAYDRRGWLPIHVACSVGASYHVVKVMLDAFPASVALTTNKGSTPRRCCDMTRNSRDYDRICEMLEKARDEWDADQPVPAKRPSSVRLLV
uniref:Uncharacterized protein n=1 Tax=Pseudictyota dubia TaxID=2749911 RepID=A0A7R9WIX1_9STRA|mmetsp:Transcript_6975/g.12515  ORF Transcript_6975/g.12515 Transcript_6975/m.12515 type:complete len:255 (+) Transcript_6975:262-1026(+)|eukprot:CAMPEP_0197434738 /NCGR_PEP_ID=MMETSP1175-20131217/2431_1 /TAXON_ID=1003142 /ORGANISM="Triceratium dubium, Strain CCMP147" /LENGTH=254 /DNA_ID=CAMNT_0042963571 /DNA_START=236 /DNA_END=1000 /DNA_ORIENTATION=-